MDQRIRWAAVVENVREAALLGSADLAYWEGRLGREGLVPAANAEGKAQILIVAAELRYMGIRFREMSFSVLVAPTGAGEWQGEGYLLQAFSTSRVFAFCERAIFSTPYHYGEIEVTVEPPASIRRAVHGKVVFSAEMGLDASGQARTPARYGVEGWEGLIHLPSSDAGSGKAFFARIRGETWAYPFAPGVDCWSIPPPAGCRLLRALVESDFVPLEWTIRPDASHAKSKTYQRDRLPRISSSAPVAKEQRGIERQDARR